MNEIYFSLNELFLSHSARETLSNGVILPNEIIFKIFSDLNFLDLQKSFGVCKKWRAFSADPFFQEIIKEKVKDYFSPRMIEALGGIEIFLSFPIIKLKVKRREKLDYSGTIQLSDASHPIMRGIYFDGTPFITLKYTMQEFNTPQEGLIFIYKSSIQADIIWSKKGDGKIGSPPINVLEEKENVWNKADWLAFQSFVAGHELKKIRYGFVQKFKLIATKEIVSQAPFKAVKSSAEAVKPLDFLVLRYFQKD